MCEAWEKIDAITIIAIEGWCVGGGAALAGALAGGSVTPGRDDARCPWHRFDHDSIS
jgi:hypothetical protein